MCLLCTPGKRTYRSVAPQVTRAVPRISPQLPELVGFAVQRTPIQPLGAGNMRADEREVGMIRLLVLLLIVWFAIGAIAAGQRHEFSGSADNCAKDSTTAVTVLAGPLNYAGVNPKTKCPHPSGS